MKIYFSWDYQYPVFRRDKFFDSRRYPLVVNSGVDMDVYTLTYELVYDRNKVIDFSYTKESLKYTPYEKQLEGFLLSHNLALSSISPIPVRISVPPKEYERLESELLEEIKRKYKRVKIKGMEGTYAYDEAIINGCSTDVHIVELDKWVNSCEIETKKFQKELDEAIDYFCKYDAYGSCGVFIRNF